MKCRAIRKAASMARTATPMAMESRRLMRRSPARSLGWRRRAEIEVVLLLQLTDHGRQVDKLRLHRLHFRFDLVHLPGETLRAAVRANPRGLSAAQTGQLLQSG